MHQIHVSSAVPVVTLDIGFSFAETGYANVPKLILYMPCQIVGVLVAGEASYSM